MKRVLRKYADLIILATIVFVTALLTEYSYNEEYYILNKVSYFINIVASVLLGMDVITRIVISYYNWVKKG